MIGDGVALFVEAPEELSPGGDFRFGDEACVEHSQYPLVGGRGGQGGEPFGDGGGERAVEGLVGREGGGQQRSGNQASAAERGDGFGECRQALADLKRRMTDEDVELKTVAERQGVGQPLQRGFVIAGHQDRRLAPRGRRGRS